jgi:two-component system, sensor histidine kinase LadS
VGDQLLAQVATRIREVIREIDTPARYGGDEFLVLCEQVRSEEERPRLRRRIAANIGEPMLVDDAELRVGVSIGIAVVPPDVRLDADAVIEQTDEAMYGAKNVGASYRFERIRSLASR